jgi:glycosyltransferase involved in cell wall biosynthesis
MNILLVITDNTGLQYHRQIVPHIVLDSITGGGAINVTSTGNFDMYPDEKLKDQQIVIFLRAISMTRKSAEVVRRCHKNGCKVILDIDDYWNLPSDHGMFRYRPPYFEINTVEAIEAVDLVTTTTKFFAKIIKVFNRNTFVLPNCIDTHQEQWKSSKVESDKIRYGWVGGVWHKEDIKLMEDSFQYLYSDLKVDNYNIALGGWNDNPEYKEIELIMAANGRAKEKYLRMQGMDYNNYGLLYDHLDVALVPLRNNMFNNCKSPLKLIEAGIKGCAVIASDIQPYNVFPKSTYYPVPTYDNKKGWYKAIKTLNKEKRMREDLASNLSEYVSKEYDVKEWALTRYQLYLNLLK